MRLLIVSATLLPLANAAAPEALVGHANAVAIGEDGWALIPYGDTLHNGANAEQADGLAAVRGRPGVVQRFTRERAVAMANAFHSLRGRIKRAVVGMDIYKGHPDCAAFANLFPDKSARGAIADMQARDDGLAFKPVLNERGVADVDDGWDHFSPFWYAAQVGEENGVKIYEPVRLKSIGLVGGAGSRHMRGNIPGLSLVNADPSTAPLSPDMKKELIELLALLGITVPPETAETSEAFAPFLADAKTKLADLKPKADLDKMAGEKAKAEGDLAAANARATEAEGKIATAETALANAKTEADTAGKGLRGVAARAVVSLAIVSGRVAAADRATHETALANAADFGAAADALAAKPVTLPVQSKVGDLGKIGKDAGDRQGKLLGLVNAALETDPIKALPAHERYDAAYAAVINSDQGKAILGTMKRAGEAAK